MTRGIVVLVIACAATCVALSGCSYSLAMLMRNGTGHRVQVEGEGVRLILQPGQVGRLQLHTGTFQVSAGHERWTYSRWNSRSLAAVEPGSDRFVVVRHGGIGPHEFYTELKPDGRVFARALADRGQPGAIAEPQPVGYPLMPVRHLL